MWEICQDHCGWFAVILFHRPEHTGGRISQAKAVRDGGLVGPTSLGPVIIQGYLTTDVWQRNYGGTDVRGWVRLVVHSEIPSHPHQRLLGLIADFEIQPAPEVGRSVCLNFTLSPYVSAPNPSLASTSRESRLFLYLDLGSVRAKLIRDASFQIITWQRRA